MAACCYWTARQLRTGMGEDSLRHLEYCLNLMVLLIVLLMKKADYCYFQL